MAISVTSAPVQVPTGIRVTTGLFDFNGASYTTAGIVTTAAQWGAGVGTIPNRFPDFVIFNAASAATTDDATTAAPIFKYLKASGKVQVFGSEPLVDEEGLGEDDQQAMNAHAEFLAIWVQPETIATA
jgi:hypothetical protein